MLYIARYTPQDRKTDAGREHRLGRQLLRYGLEQEYGRTWEAVCGPHGRPVLAEGPEGLQFSITHTRGLAACRQEQEALWSELAGLGLLEQEELP